MWRLNDLFGVNPAHPAELISVAAFMNLDRIRERARTVVEADRAVLDEFLAGQPSVSAPATAFGTTALLHLRAGNVDEFLERLRFDYETTAVPGRFFEMPDHFRIGMGVNTEIFREGLRRLNQALATSPAIAARQSE
jgi:hypothetical protein